MRTFSFGGGVQSTAALVLAAQEKIDYRIFLFANVGDDSENPATLTYMQEFSIPYAAEQGIELHNLKRTYRDGRKTSLLEELTSDHANIPIPVYMANGAPGRRQCTDRWKRKVIAKWQKEHGATEKNPAICGLGISTDEIMRMRDSSGIPYQVLEYPLIDLRLTRKDCYEIIVKAGLPLPPKSSCWFCPFHKKAEWQEIARLTPDLFDKAVQLEERINEKRDKMGKDHVYLHTSKRPLAEATVIQEKLFEDDYCDSGFCMT